MLKRSILQEMKMLTKEDQAVYAAMIKSFNIDTNKKFEIWLKWTAKFNERQLFVLSEKDAIIRDFFEKNDIFNKKLVENGRYPGFLPKVVFASMDKKIICSPFRILMGTFLLEQFEDHASSNGAIDLLNKACNEGSFHALGKRMQMNLDAIRSMTTSSDVKIDLLQIKSLIQKIVDDGYQIGNLYRSLGYINVFNILMDVAHAFYQLPEVKSDLERYNDAIMKVSRARGDPQPEKQNSILILENLVENSIKFYYLAFLTSELPISKMLTHVINHGQGLLDGFKTCFSDWESGQKYLSLTVKQTFQIKSSRLFVQAEKEANEKIKQYSSEKDDKSL